MSTAKDILHRCRYLMSVAEGSDSRRLLAVKKSLKNAMDALEYFRNSSEPWNQDIVDNLKKSVEVVAITMEEMLAYEHGCEDLKAIVGRRNLYKGLRKKVQDVQKEVGINSPVCDHWLLMAGYANELANASEHLLLEEQETCQIIASIVEQEISKYYELKEFA